MNDTRVERLWRHEGQNGEVFYARREAQILIESRKKHDNTKRPRSTLGYRPPAPEKIIQIGQRPPLH